MEIPGLRNSLLKVLRDYELQIGLTEVSTKAVQEDFISLFEKTLVHPGVMIDREVYCDICKYSIFQKPKLPLGTPSGRTPSPQSPRKSSASSPVVTTSINRAAKTTYSMATSNEPLCGISRRNSRYWRSTKIRAYARPVMPRVNIRSTWASRMNQFLILLQGWIHLEIL